MHHPRFVPDMRPNRRRQQPNRHSVGRLHRVSPRSVEILPSTASEILNLVTRRKSSIASITFTTLPCCFAQTIIPIKPQIRRPIFSATRRASPSSTINQLARRSKAIEIASTSPACKPRNSGRPCVATDCTFSHPSVRAVSNTASASVSPISANSRHTPSGKRTVPHRSYSQDSQPIFAIAESGDVSLTTQACMEVMFPVSGSVVNWDFPQSQFALEFQPSQPGHLRSLRVGDASCSIHSAGKLKQHAASPLSLIAGKRLRNPVWDFQCHLHGGSLRHAVRNCNSILLPNQ